MLGESPEAVRAPLGGWVPSFLLMGLLWVPAKHGAMCSVPLSAVWGWEGDLGRVVLSWASREPQVASPNVCAAHSVPWEGGERLQIHPTDFSQP